MANVSGQQSDVQFCPYCKELLINVLRNKMKTTVKNRSDEVPHYTHTYHCAKCGRTYEINQHRAPGTGEAQISLGYGSK